MILDRSFYQSDDVVTISKQLLGKKIITKLDGAISGGIIVETEAYRAPDDRACHAYGNRLTNRTKTMFMEGGTLYVYIIYGIHRMINVVTAEEGKAHAVLIRAIEPVLGIDKMVARRNQKNLSQNTVNGPGKLASALGVDTVLDGVSLFNKESGIWIEDLNHSISEECIVSGPRVGLSKHTERDAHRPWRFYIKDNKWVSKPKIVAYPDIPKF